MGASTNTAVIVLATQRSVFKFRFVDIDFMSVLHMVFFPQVLLSAPSTATTATAASSAKASTHAGRTATATCPRTRAVVPLGTPSEGVPVSAAAARQIPATYTVRPSPACTKPTASPIAEATIAAPIAGEIAALSSDLLPGAGLAASDRVIFQRSDDSSAPVGSAEIVSIADVPNSLTIRLPQEFSADSAYTLWVVNAQDERSNPVHVNDARPLWITPDHTYTTGSIANLPRVLKVVGRNLQPAAGAATRVRLTGPRTYTLTASPAARDDRSHR